MNLGKTIVAGLVGTAVMTVLIMIAPMMGMPEMNIPAMLGEFTGMGTTVGWVMHFVIGSVLAVIYAWLFQGRLPGGPVVAGALYGFLVFLLAQVAVTPMMGGAVFSGGDVPMIMGSLLGHLVYGGVVGGMLGAPATAEA
jgi:uncharacterized membrane protein YagU involved in acid resistance